MTQFTDNVQLVNGAGKVLVSLDQSPNVDIATVRAGGQGYNGELAFSDKSGHLRIGLNSDLGSLNIWRAPNAGEELKPMLTLSLHLSSDPSISLRLNGKSTIRIDGSRGDVWLGGNGVNGDLMLFRKDGDNESASQASIRLNGDAGDIILQNSDCAEDFSISDSEVVEPGDVVVIDEGGHIRSSAKPYDKKVAGVVSGAEGLRPGIVLGRKLSLRGATLALVGRVFCKVDSSYAAIGFGDLLTTSATKGHAMKADDPSLAFGCVLGKALASHTRGTGLIPVLVSLQ